MILTERKKLLSFLRTKERIQGHITQLKEEYLDACNGPLIYVSDHAIVRYLERVEKIKLQGTTDTNKIFKYLREGAIDAKELRTKILTKPEMRHIVSNEISRYEKQGYIYIIKNLGLITIYKKETK